VPEDGASAFLRTVGKYLPIDNPNISEDLNLQSRCENTKSWTFLRGSGSRLHKYMHLRSVFTDNPSPIPVFRKSCLNSSLSVTDK
jgi:hypothetical protein